MALIKCEDCGKMVSDRASDCPNCGAPIVKKTLCEECGKEIPNGSTACPACGCPVASVDATTQQIVNQQVQSVPPQITQPAQTHTYFTPNAASNKEQRVQRFLMTNRKFLPQQNMEEIRNWLMSLSDSQMNSVETIKFKDPMIMLLISFLVGYLGVDRFMLEDTTNGALKLILSFLCVGMIWWLIDLFLITDKTLEYNYAQLQEAGSYL